MSATRGTCPAFQVYAFDLMAKNNYRLMTLAERGLLFSMWCECWANIELPSEQNELASLLGRPNEISGALTQRVISFFELSPKKTYFSPDLEKYRAEVLEQRARMSEGGSKGGKKRAENEKRAREGSGHPSHPSQATLKGRESENESESGRENELPESANNSNHQSWINDYERASKGQ